MNKTGDLAKGNGIGKNKPHNQGIKIFDEKLKFCVAI